MTSLVLELQRDALDSTIPVADLLRKALVVARKLSIGEIEAWINLELNGYPSDGEAPSYRLLSCQVKVKNPYLGWQPVIIPNPKIAKSVSRGAIGSGVGHLESQLKDSQGGFLLSLDPELEAEIMRGINVRLQPVLHVDRGQIHAVLETVRNITLEWSLKLERDGILGEGMSFSSSEKRAASAATYKIKTFINEMSHSQIQQDTQGSIQTLNTNTIDLNAIEQLIQTIHGCIDQLMIPAQQESELDADIRTIETQIKSPKPKPVIIRESLHSIRNILEGAVGSGLASGIIYEIARLLQ